MKDEGILGVLARFPIPKIRKLFKKLGEGECRLNVCYEAEPTGYGIYRFLTALGIECCVVAPSLIPRGVKEITAVILVVEIGTFERIESARDYS